MHKIVIEVDDTELRLIPSDEILLPLKISGWNFEEGDIVTKLDDELRCFILEFARRIAEPKS